MEWATLMKLGVWVEVEEWCTAVKFFSHSRGQGQGHGGPNFDKYDPYLETPTGSTKANGGFHIISFWDALQGVTEPEFAFSSKGLGHVTPNLCYLARSANYRAWKPEMTVSPSRDWSFHLFLIIFYQNILKSEIPFNSQGRPAVAFHLKSSNTSESLRGILGVHVDSVQKQKSVENVKAIIA